MTDRGQDGEHQPWGPSAPWRPASPATEPPTAGRVEADDFTDDCLRLAALIEEDDLSCECQRRPDAGHGFQADCKG